MSVAVERCEWAHGEDNWCENDQVLEHPHLDGIGPYCVFHGQVRLWQAVREMREEDAARPAPPVEGA